MKLLGGCEAFSQRFGLTKTNCCLSCHEDDEGGYFQLTEKEVGDDWYNVCCAMLLAYDDKVKGDRDGG